MDINRINKRLVFKINIAINWNNEAIAIAETIKLIGCTQKTDWQKQK